MAVKLDPRLLAIAEMVRLDGKICDVGTDHALLPCFLAQQGAADIIASDVNDGPLKAASLTIAQYGFENSVRVMKSDGLRDIPPCDDVIVAGMGGELIARIITECTFINENTRFILQPMTKPEILRRELYINGFEIEKECTAQSAGKTYTVMLVKFTGKKSEIDDSFAFFGKNNDKIYAQAVNARLRKLAKGNKAYSALIRE
ncbi:MAG: SAM-dependent methyltransferase [Ruminiclostridium sp.]|nr:SAM-dependent methyltransferase [Ruminiclostridium sp.]